MRELHVVDAGELAAAYAAAHYAVVLDGDAIGLQVGEPAGDLEAYWTARSYAFITAWNPASRPLSEAANNLADSRLVARLQALGLVFHPAWASDHAREWRESGWLVGDIDPAQLDTLAIEFGQAGVLYWEHGKPVRLRMTLRRPGDCPGLAFVDWIELATADR
ncbi:DUF3293 domain-containing protein [Marilutibacter alkalisoli]|uniref:DUF3293 domain-containing protein n=1 Tax=Marilutibacter alkalisoli TaxID=2591633 RepID=A0A514BS90_9GAMM|nr:DUF3293 domain-containing protein [Lysobacter alkalisoli]QDH69889.1 DUF3293 domain-containing protein [Lysobacter alkalisoli]